MGRSGIVGEYRREVGQAPVASAIVRPRRNWTRGVAAQHASLSRWRSPVRIRSGPPSPAFPYAPSARPDGAFFCPPHRRRAGLRGRPLSQSAGDETASPARGPGPARAGHRPADERRHAGVRRGESGAVRDRRRTEPVGGRERHASPREHRGAAVRVRAATPTHARRRRPRPTPGAAGRCRGRAGHPVPGHRDEHQPRRGRRASSPARASATRRWSWSRRRRTRSSRPSGRAARPTPTSLVLVPDAAALTKDLAKHRKRLAFLRADAVTPAVRALAWGGRSLFGVDRVTTAADWRLHAQLPAAAADAAFDPARDVDDVRRRRHPPGPRRVPDDPDQGQGRRLPVRRRDGRDHRPHLLLGVRLGAAGHAGGPATAGRCGS